MPGSWIGDIRYAARRLRAQRGYALVAVLTLALGVGGTAATYCVTRGVLFDSLPYAHQDRVGMFWKKTDWTEEEFTFIRGRVPGFEEVALYRQRDAILRDGDGPARLVSAVSSSAELFDVLGAAPLIGRGFRAGDDAPGAEPTAILSFGLWQQMGGLPSILGQPVMVDGRPRTVIGVMPRGFWFPDPSVRIWTQVPLNPQARNWNSTLVGRVAAGQDLRAMAEPLRQLTATLDERFDYPAQWDKTKDPHITPLRDDLTGTMRPALLATLGAMALILLIACANVAALLLGQVEARSVEFAVRSALGASRQRLTRPVVVEALLLALAGGACGAALAWAGFDGLMRALPLGVWAEPAVPDWRVVASAMAMACAATMLVIVAPILSLGRGDLRGVLTGARTGGVRRRGAHLENALVVAEVALAVTIATAAALIARSVSNLYDVDPGVRTEHVAVVDLIVGGNVTRARHEQILAEVESALARLPGVRSAGTAQTLPLRGGGYNMGLEIDGQDIAGMTTEYRVVTPGYLESAGFALVDGRTISAGDRRGTERVAVINQAFARKHFAGSSPVGRVIGGDVNERSRVVGVVADAVERRLGEAAVPVRYVALAQMPWIDAAQSVVLHTAAGIDETALLESARLTIGRVAPGVVVQETTTMRRLLDTAIGPARPLVMLLSLLTALALVLGSVGIYGVIAHFATRRRRDWAIRLALGLPGSRVIAQVVGHGALLVSAGIGAGVIAAAALTRLLSSLLYGVTAIDPVAFVGAAALLLAVGTLAALVPAFRAGMTDPAIALREP
jgi:predicted permease